ncbi:Protein kinase:GAF [Sterolibacterium denitrificans]|uniref:Protein kinase:GAF n=2 Tax=Sterolibacterium denitrificans TaxID=157592 RepID=A0A7Z7MVV3_9PROT|nr:serine/threonine protein kinase [Sterolibacterium denitrificans]KYC29165.1 serine/threonine protein kinase [Sterolibacterium denitrificans]SMB29373.1 Protein kinase:GAF [Sterolibacterium denitrificans]
MTRKIGRFEVLHELGRGAQSVVYLCNDPHLQREVAIKTLHFSEADPRLNAHLLAEARTVGKLRHANIVPIFEAGEEEGDPYLVFEYVAGESLAQVLQREPIEPLQAAGIAADILGALAEAHAQGIIHRDLKPSNIIIDGKGVPRVMDFGIAVRISDGANGGNGGNGANGLALQVDGLMGTPPYLAPEYVRERVVSAQTDIHAMGLVLLEMLTGRRTRQATDLQAMLQLIASEPVQLPKDAGIDERLAAIILKAVAQEPALRYQTAEQMRAALRDYLAPPLSETGDGAAAAEFLLRKMRHKSDFPVLSESVQAINRLTDSDKDSINKLSNAVLKDYALTAKLLKIVNSPVYRQAGGGSISTVSRAVIVLGFDAIRNIALSVMMFEHLQNKANATQIKEAFLRANLSGLLGRDIGKKLAPREAEELFICSMFHGLGRLLAQYYFPEEVEDMRRLMAQRNCSDEAAVQQVLGTSFEALGVAVAQKWGFPPAIVKSMRRMPAGASKKPATREDTLQTVANFSNELCDSIANTPAVERGRVVQQVAERYAAAIRFPDEQLKLLVQQALAELEQIATGLRVNLKQSPFVQQARSWSGGAVAAASATAAAGAAEGSRRAMPGFAEVDTDLAQTVLTEAGTVLQTAPGMQDRASARGANGVGGENGALTADALESAEFAESGAGGMAAAPGREVAASDVQAMLTAGIQDISNSLVDDFSLNDILRIILETMYRAMGFERVLLCLRDVKTGSMVGRFGFGPDTGEIARKFRFSLKEMSDVFSVAALKGVDLLITDINDPKIGERIPQWHRQHVLAETFVLFPLVLKDAPVAMIYCDKRKAGDIVISPSELTLLKTLRNQAVLAIKQAS